jgi:peptidyl-prolyl cis-trans isomerase D
MKSINLVAALSVLFVYILAGCQFAIPIASTPSPLATATPESPLVAVIGDVEINQDQLFTQIRYTRFQLIANFRQYKQAQKIYGNYPGLDQALQQIQIRLEDSPTLGQSVLEDMVNEVLVRQEAAKMGIKVSAEEVETAFEEAFHYYAKGTPSPVSTYAPVATLTLSSLQATLQVKPAGVGTPFQPAAPTASPTPALVVPVMTPTPYTFQAYQNVLKTQVASFSSINFSEADMRKLVESKLLRKKMMAKVLAGQKAESDQVWARHILLKDEATAADVTQRLRNGENWYNLASNYSIDKGTKDQGGDLGWFGKGKMVVEFENAAFALNVGEMSGPVKSQFGYHIIQILGHEKRPLPAADMDQFFYEQFQNWVLQLRASHNQEVELFTTWRTAVPTEPNLTATDLGQ